MGKRITIAITEWHDTDIDKAIRTKNLLIEDIGDHRCRVSNGEAAEVAEFIVPGRVPAGRKLIELTERACIAIMNRHRNKGIK